MSTVLAGAPGAELDVELIAEALSGGSLVADYLSGAPGMTRFYTGHPGDMAAYRRKAAEVEARLDARRRSLLAGAIVPLGDAESRLSRILSGEGFFVTTGQQPALFGGPLYTLYKALAAIRTAVKLERALGTPVLALFWVGADDHDWDEANHVSVLDEHGRVERLEVRAPADALPLPLSARTWGRGVSAAVERLRQLLPDTPAGSEVAAHLARDYTQDSTVEASFTRTMTLLLRDRRIALLSSAHPALREAAVPVLLREAANAGAHFEKVQRQTSRLEAAGYPVQVEITPDASNIMHLDERGRDRLVRAPGGWRTRREHALLSESNLLALIRDEPQRFSPNVLLRPVVENAVLPTIAYVAGPGELRYFAQVGCLFEAHGILPPVVVPRTSMTIVEPAIRRILDDTGCSPDMVRQPFDTLLTAAVRRQLPPPVSRALEQLRAQAHTAWAELTDAAAAVDPTLRGPLIAARNRTLMQANDAEARIMRQLKRRNVVLAGRLERAWASLFPGGKPQERVLGVLPFLARYGHALIPRLEQAMEPVPDSPRAWTGPDCAG